MTRVLSVEFVRSYGVTMRPYLLFVSGITGIAGMALGPAIGAFDALVAGSAFFLSYGFGQAVTDCFQLDTDSLSAPYRPLVQGRVSRGQVLAVSAGGLVFCGVTLILFHPLNALLAFLTVAGLASYTYFKRRWWAGPFYNAWIVALLVVMGCLVAAGAAGTRSGLSAVSTDVLVVGALAFFGYANFVLSGYFKDVSADRATGYHTLPVVFGLRVSTLASDVFALLAVAAAVLATLPGIAGNTLATHAPALALLGAGMVAAAVGQVRLHNVRSEATAYPAIVAVVHAYVLLLASVAVRHRPPWTFVLLAFYAAFAIAMARRPERSQI